MNQISMTINNESDLVTARLKGRDVAKDLGFGVFDQTLISTAISELARNILEYAGTGTIEVESTPDAPQKGVRVRAIDKGPGIEDLEAAQREGYSTSGSLGVGLSGVQRLMDEFSIESEPARGTTVEVLKWL